jgi:hypothetical protein
MKRAKANLAYFGFTATIKPFTTAALTFPCGLLFIEIQIEHRETFALWK